MHRRIIGVIAAAAVISLGLTVAPMRAGAYDGGSCGWHGADDTFDGYDTFKVDTGSTGMVDFGDHPHWGGAPQGTAVVCWGSNGRASFEGQLFADTTGSAIRVKAVINFFRRSGAAVNPYPYELTGNWGASRHIKICCINENGLTGNFDPVDGVRLDLFRGTRLVRQVFRAR